MKIADRISRIQPSITLEMTAKAAELRDKGVPDKTIFEFSQSLIRHYDPIELKRLEKLSDEKDALFKEANDL